MSGVIDLEAEILERPRRYAERFRHAVTLFVGVVLSRH